MSDGRERGARPEGPARPVRPEPLPDLAWDAGRTREFADGAADVFSELIARLPELPVARAWRREDVERGVAREVPEEPMDQADLLSYLRSMLLEYSVYAGHPRFMAYISGAGTVPGAVADMLASGGNMNVGGWRLST